MTCDGGLTYDGGPMTCDGGPDYRAGGFGGLPTDRLLVNFE